MRWAIILTIMLAGCAEKESAKLERQYEMMKNADRDVSELCAKAREIAGAHLSEENSQEYQRWNVSAAADCTEAAQR